VGASFDVALITRPGKAVTYRPSPGMIGLVSLTISETSPLALVDSVGLLYVYRCINWRLTSMASLIPSDTDPWLIPRWFSLPVTFVPMHAEWPVQRAADFLNVSSSYFNRLLDEGTVPFREDGAGRRILFRDLVEYKKRSDAERREALQNLAALGQEIGEGY
jgi:excisionase family DNA binding protein